MKPNKKDFNSVAEYYQAMAYYCAEMAEILKRGLKAEEFILAAEGFQDLADELIEE